MCSEQHLRDKRQNRAGGQGAQQTEAQPAGAAESQIGQMDFGKVTAQVQISIQEALNQLQQLPSEQFTQLANNMVFQVSACIPCLTEHSRAAGAIR